MHYAYVRKFGGISPAPLSLLLSPSLLGNSGHLFCDKRAALEGLREEKESKQSMYVCMYACT